MNLRKSVSYSTAACAALLAFCLHLSPQAAFAQTSSAANASSPPVATPVPASAPPESASKSKPQLTVWTPDPAQMPNLAPVPLKFGNYSVLPPLGFKVAKQGSFDGAANAYLLGMNPKSDDPATALAVVDVNPPRYSYAHDLSVESMMQSFLQGTMQDDHKIGWYISPVQKGMINGVTYDHVTWSGSKKQNGPATYGILYATLRNDGTYVLVNCIDESPDNGDALAVLNASAETLKISD